VFKRVVEILKCENINVPDAEKSKLLELVRNNYPDLRRIVNDVQKYSYTGTLTIRSNSAKSLAENIVTKIINKVQVGDIRKYTIEREQEFSGDYLFLLKEMFEYVFDSNLDQEKKNNWLLQLSDAMYKDSIVVDKEINWFSCCIRLSN
jgi:hypothetical protein